MNKPNAAASVSHYLVIDFEATCYDHSVPQAPVLVPRHEMEIIEFGAVMVAADSLTPLDEFQSFVRPVRHPVLTPFCTALTSITQQDVDAAPGFAEVLTQFANWLQNYPNLLFCSWGNYDRQQLVQDCQFHRLPYPIPGAHCNVKERMAEQQKLSKKPGLAQAVQLAGLPFTGTHHRGIDDARNIAQLLPYIFGDKVLAKKR